MLATMAALLVLFVIVEASIAAALVAFISVVSIAVEVVTAIATDSSSGALVDTDGDWNGTIISSSPSFGIDDHEDVPSFCGCCC